MLSWQAGGYFGYWWIVLLAVVVVAVTYWAGSVRNGKRLDRDRLPYTELDALDEQLRHGEISREEYEFQRARLESHDRGAA